MARPPEKGPLQRALRYFEESKQKHIEFVGKVEERYKAYRGVLDEVESQEWTSKLHPPYIMHIIETTLASMVETRRRARVKPRVTVEMLRDPAAAERATQGARFHQILHDWQSKEDKLLQIERPFALQNGIAGLTVAKTYWRQEEQMRRRMVPVEQPVTLEDGSAMLNPYDGTPLTVPQLVEHEGMTVVYDGPTTEVVDVRDFGWHEAATSLEKARYVWHRVWMGFEEIEELVEAGTFGPERGGDTAKEIADQLKNSRDFKDELSRRETELFNVDRTKDLIEVVELWDNVKREVTTFANRKVLLSHRPFPFWHNRPPFVVCSTQPDLFRIPGISQVEKIAHLQDMLWMLQNQRIDNLTLINNAIFMLGADVDEEFEFEPGAQWLLEDPTKVQMWTPNVIPAEVSLGAEALLKGDLQSLSGGFPFASGAESQTVDQKTATGASIVTSLAQRSINLYKDQLDLAWQAIGEQRMLLNMQFVRENTAVPVTGLDGKEYVEEVIAELLSGDFSYELEPSSDALMKQEEQASAQALVQLAAQLVPIHAALAASGAAKMLNLDAFTEDLLRAFGKDDIERYFSAAPPAAMPAPGGAGAPAPGGPEEQPMGVTAPQSIDPAVSPSSSVSMAPSSLMQRALALSRGGGQNVAQA